MQAFDNATALAATVGAVRVARFDQYGLGDTLPFSAMWYSVPPGASSPPDRHPELELSVVVSGSAAVETGGRVHHIESGSAFLLDSDEPHVVHNSSDATALVVFSVYWLPSQMLSVVPAQRKAVGA